MPATGVVEEVVERLRTFASAFDAAVVPATDLAQLVEVTAEIERLAAGVRIQAAARVADSGVWRAKGDKTADAWMARVTHTSIGQAGAELGTGVRLRTMSKTAEAVRAGRLTADQAKEITSATYHAPAAEDRLLEVAGRASLRDLRDAARAARQATEDDAARHARIRRNRYLRTTTDPEGAFCLSMRGPASDGVWLLAALRPFHAGQFAANRAASTPVGFEATAYDALMAMAHAAHGHLPESTQRSDDRKAVDRDGGSASGADPRSCNGANDRATALGVDVIPLWSEAGPPCSGESVSEQSGARGRAVDTLTPTRPEARRSDHAIPVRAGPVETSERRATDASGGCGAALGISSPAVDGGHGDDGRTFAARPNGPAGTPDGDLDAVIARQAEPHPAVGRSMATSGSTSAESCPSTPPPSASQPPTRGGRDVKVIVRVDAAALMRGHPVDGEVVEIAGVGPVPVSAVRELLPEALVAVVVTKGVDVAAVAHAGRRLTAQQLTAIEWRTPVCTVIGCPCTVSLEDDHRQPWSEGGATDITNLDRLCHHHHDLKTNHGFRLEPGVGRRRLLPPDHPDHPEHR